MFWGYRWDDVGMVLGYFCHTVPFVMIVFYDLKCVAQHLNKGPNQEKQQQQQQQYIK